VTLNRLTNKDKLNSIGLLLLRVSVGLGMLLGHGLGKWTKLFEGSTIQFVDPFGFGSVASLIMAVFAEVFCASLLIFGLLTRWFLIPLIITMAVAVFYVHFADGFREMEKALLYLAAFITLFFTGSGKYSIDSLIQVKK